MNRLFALDFSFEILDIKRFHDVSYVDTLMDIAVTCDGFAGKMQMEIDYADLCAFVQNLKTLYDRLAGAAEIKEPWGNQAYIRFECDRTGHIVITGKLNEMENCLKFRKTIDQTDMKEFINSFGESL